MDEIKKDFKRIYLSENNISTLKSIHDDLCRSGKTYKCPWADCRKCIALFPENEENKCPCSGDAPVEIQIERVRELLEAHNIEYEKESI